MDIYIYIAGRNNNFTCDLDFGLVSISELHTALVDSSGRVGSQFFVQRSLGRFESGPVVCKYDLFWEPICVNYGGSDRVWSDQNICY